MTYRPKVQSIDLGHSSEISFMAQAADIEKAFIMISMAKHDQDVV